MYKIKLIGELSSELTIIGCEVGDEVHATFQKTNQAMYFDVMHYGHLHHCVVWPENYEIVFDPSQKKVTVPAVQYFIDLQRLCNGDVSETQILEFYNNHNHTVTSDLKALVLDIRLFCDKNSLFLEVISDELTWVVGSCIIVSATLIKASQ